MILPCIGEKADPSTSEWQGIQARRFRCPADKKRKTGQSYGLNVFFELNPDFDDYEGNPQGWRTLSSLPRPSRTILLAEIGGSSDHVMAHFWEGEGTSGLDCSHDRHDGKAHYAFADGHIELLGLDAIYSPSKGINLWNPSLAK
jgi:prepilin-type processing-associated H-X9-DG protein